MPRVIISSGHTSNSPGSIANGLREVDVAKQIARAITPYLRANGVITLSAPPDLELEKRIEWVNKSGYEEKNNDAAIEIHINDGGKSGFEGWFEGRGGNKSQELSDKILTAVTAETGLPNQGAKSEYEHELGSIAFLNETQPVASLIECCYIDNATDAEFLKKDENIIKIAKGIAKGILSYFNINFTDIVQPQTKPSINLPQRQPAPNTKTSAPPPRPTPITPPPMNFNPGGFGDDYDDFDDMGGGFSPPPPIGGMRGGQPGGFNQMPSREERKDMITKMYTKILGREPNQNDTNYFLNIGIKEDELIKKMIDSQEHADLVKARQEVLEAKKKYADQQTEFLQLKSVVTDQNRIIKGLQDSIYQKNIMYAQMQQKVNDLIYQVQSHKISTTPGQNGSSGPRYKGGFLDRVFKAFSDIFD